MARKPFPSDVSDEEWAFVAPYLVLMKQYAPQRQYGLREIFNGPRYAVRAGGAGKLITNLRGDGAVEVACLVDRNGISPTRYGNLPPQMAHVCASNMAYFDLAAACINKSKEAATFALTLDPLTAAVCTPKQIKAMTAEIFAAEAEFLPGYK